MSRRRLRSLKNHRLSRPSFSWRTPIGCFVGLFPLDEGKQRPRRIAHDHELTLGNWRRSGPGVAIKLRRWTETRRGGDKALRLLQVAPCRRCRRTPARHCLRLGRPNLAITSNGAGLLVPIGVGVAVLLAAAALVVALVNGNGKASPAPGPTQSASPEPAEVLVDDADRDLCLAIGPLMNESQDTRNAFQRFGPPESPENEKLRSRSLLAIRATGRVEHKHVLNEHSEPPRFLTRTFQRYIDDTMLYVVSLAPDRDLEHVREADL